MRQLRVAVQGDDKPHIGQLIRIADVNQALGVVGRVPIDQVIELFQLAAFAFPADEFLLGFAPFPLPVEQEEPLAAMALIEGFDALLSRFAAGLASASQ